MTTTTTMNQRTRIAVIILVVSLLALLAFRLLAADPPGPNQLVTITLTPAEAAAVSALIQAQNQDNAAQTPPGIIYTPETFFRERLDQTIKDAVRSLPNVDRRNLIEDVGKLTPQDVAEISALVRTKLGK